MTKYSAIRTEVDGVSFASKKEARRYGELKLLQRTGQIRDLELQPRFKLAVNGWLVTTYVGDFSYRHATPLGDHDALVVEDVKGFRTPLYKLKAKLFRACLGFPITEV